MKYLCGNCIHFDVCYVPRSIGCVEICGHFKEEPKEPLTNEEYIRTCSTAELVHEIHLMTSNCYVCGSDGVDYRRCYFRKKCTGPKEIEEWLKEIRK